MSGSGLISNGTGYYSGLNISQLVSTLVQADSQPLTDLQSEVATDNAEISAYGSLASSISPLYNMAQSMALPTVYGLTATSSDNSVLTATAGMNATPGNYSIGINQLAQAQSIYSAGLASDTTTAVASSGDTGFEIDSNGKSATITYDSTNNVFGFGGQTYANSLQGVASAINAASQAGGLGVTAAVVNNGSTYQLTVASNNTGAANRMKILVEPSGSSAYGDATGTTGINQLAFDPAYNTDGSVNSYGSNTNMKQSVAATDASLTFNGINVTRSSNTITDLIGGVTLNLLGASSSPVNMTVANDNAGLTTQVNSFISTYNTLTAAINSAMGTQQSPGALYNDSLTKNLGTQLWDLTTNSYNGTTLADLGITHDDNGNLQLNQTAWNAALAANPSQVVGAINQMAMSLQSTLGSTTNDLIPSAKSGLNDQISLYQDQEQQQQTRLNMLQQMYTQEFQSMEQELGSLQQAGQSIASIMGSGTSSSSGASTSSSTSSSTSGSTGA